MCTNPRLIQKKGHAKKTTFRRKKGEYYELSVFAECGDCDDCRSKKANNWVCRNYYEAVEHKQKCFITLTYKNSPFFLVRKDLQNFIKRFRWEINKDYLKEYAMLKQKCQKANWPEERKKEILTAWKEEHESEYIKTRIFYCGEYGSALKTKRPHYHVIIYGWEDENAKPIRVNKKNNVIYKSTLIEELWGKGLTSYQPFGDKEAPYIALYNTSQEEFKKAYKLTREKVKKLKALARHSDKWDEEQKKNILETLEEAQAEMDKNKEEYYIIKEFNGWSQSLGWEGFIKQYLKCNVYAWQEYILGAQYSTPSPWLKKLANPPYGDQSAAEELFRRERDTDRPKTAAEAKAKAELRQAAKKKKDLLDYQTEKNGDEL